MLELEAWSGQARLRAVAELVPPGARVADIGTDHGLLPRRLLASGRAASCIATERGERSLTGAAKFPPGHPLRERLELRTGDGLRALTPADAVDVVVIAGLGAPAICRMLSDDSPQRLGVRRLVLQPQNDPALLRGWLLGHGWKIVDERMILERGRYYIVIAAEPAAGGHAPSHPTLTAQELIEAGPRLVNSRNPLVRTFWAERQKLIAEALERARSPGARKRLQQRRQLAARVLAALPRPARGHLL